MFHEINQNTFAWHTWRGKGVGSSDVPAILQISPWVSRLELWELKTGKREPAPMNAWMERGKQMEGKARSDYEIRYSRDMTPILIEHDEETYMRASLDGWNALEKRLIEIKCPGKATVELAKAGKIPPYYEAQIQYQMMLSKAVIADYYCFDGKEGICIEVLPDLEFQNKIFTEVKSFWALVKENKMPEITDKDYVEIKDAAMRGTILEWKQIHKKIKELEVREEEFRKEIIAGLTHSRCFYKDVKIFKAQRPGGYNYAQMMEDFKINKEIYQKKPTTHYTLKLDRSDDGENQDG